MQKFEPRTEKLSLELRQKWEALCTQGFRNKTAAKDFRRLISLVHPKHYRWIEQQLKATWYISLNDNFKISGVKKSPNFLDRLRDLGLGRIAPNFKETQSSGNPPIF